MDTVHAGSVEERVSQLIEFQAELMVILKLAKNDFHAIQVCEKEGKYILAYMGEDSVIVETDLNDKAIVCYVRLAQNIADYFDDCAKDLQHDAEVTVRNGMRKDSGRSFEDNHKEFVALSAMAADYKYGAVAIREFLKRL